MWFMTLLMLGRGGSVFVTVAKLNYFRCRENAELENEFRFRWREKKVHFVDKMIPTIRLMS